MPEKIIFLPTLVLSQTRSPPFWMGGWCSRCSRTPWCLSRTPRQTWPSSLGRAPRSLGRWGGGKGFVWFYGGVEGGWEWRSEWVRGCHVIVVVGWLDYMLFDCLILQKKLGGCWGRNARREGGNSGSNVFEKLENTAQKINVMTGPFFFLFFGGRGVVSSFVCVFSNAVFFHYSK